MDSPCVAGKIFLSTLSLRRATRRTFRNQQRCSNFYPRSPYGERLGFSGAFGASDKISIHALLTESDTGRAGRCGSSPYFYPRSPYGERLANVDGLLCVVSISIHALLTESDGAGCRPCRHQSNFYPRSPYGERRLWTILYSCPGNFYPRSPYGERRLFYVI